MKINIGKKKKIALIAHDKKKYELMKWVEENEEKLTCHKLYSTRSTGKLIADKLGIRMRQMQSGPLGGDLQIGAKIVTGDIDLLIFFWDPLEAQPHDPDIRALLRAAVVWNIPLATNRATADFIFSSSLMDIQYERVIDILDE